MATLVVLFFVILLLNLLPAFAPPTWMAMSWVGFNVPDGNPFVFAVVAARAPPPGPRGVWAVARGWVVCGLNKSEPPRRGPPGGFAG
ncbi:hypothetical protein K6W25_16160, partial [Burkholderia dolosa]|nr:hypothetical protein [Burkholderia dolosa]